LICGLRQDCLIDPDKNQVHGLSNTTAKNLQTARSVSTIGSLQSIPNTQSLEFSTLQEHTTHLNKTYEQLSAEYEELRRMVMDIRSQMGGTCAHSFLLYDPENDHPPPPPPPPASSLF